eukprot:CAMPEP_0113950886 /NCGR_PEP_ID=MMETSP1339-20121228/83040_1 /TAXON_ID=94617 /ORGANISM="Fibrocapsa japonica" /LENGTH=82 /DNA_ID=CAMNT_0000958891 /DNA_START=56 /DNA_END=304 /DNA_ORIENTATION=- /assembly_acc=CAM_ASM_000762
MESGGISRNNHTYSIMIHACRIANKFSAVEKLWEQMQKEGIRPNKETYVSAIHALRASHDKRMYTLSKQLHQQMEKEGLRST